MESRKIGFTGTREGLSEYQKDEVVCWLREIQPTEVHHGMCRGGDTDFHLLVLEGLDAHEGIVTDCKIIGHPPINKKDYVRVTCDEYREEKDYLVRNKEIVDSVETLIACPLGEETLRSGTWSTVRYARKQGKEVIIIPRSYE